jgi:hypothetical protein
VSEDIHKKDTSVENIKNTFAPNMTNEYVSIDGIIDCLRFGFMSMSNLPPEISQRVQEELNRIKQTNNSKENGGAQ